jgi:hypothetical protein
MNGLFILYNLARELLIFFQALFTPETLTPCLGGFPIVAGCLWPIIRKDGVSEIYMNLTHGLGIMSYHP